MNIRESSPAAVPRCRACQLQLCKSRFEPAHPGLKEVRRENTGGGLEVEYLCDVCGTTLVCTHDVAQPGWQRRRPSSATPVAVSGG